MTASPLFLSLWNGGVITPPPRCLATGHPPTAPTVQTAAVAVALPLHSTHLRSPAVVHLSKSSGSVAGTAAILSRSASAMRQSSRRALRRHRATTTTPLYSMRLSWSGAGGGSLRSLGVHRNPLSQPDGRQPSGGPLGGISR